jgi:hypothetical protein
LAILKALLVLAQKAIKLVVYIMDTCLLLGIYVVSVAKVTVSVGVGACTIVASSLAKR